MLDNNNNNNHHIKYTQGHMSLVYPSLLCHDNNIEYLDLPKYDGNFAAWGTVRCFWEETYSL